MVMKKGDKKGKKSIKTVSDSDRIGYIVALKDSTWPHQQDEKFERVHRADVELGADSTGQYVKDEMGERHALFGDGIYGEFTSDTPQYTRYSRSRREWDLRNKNDNFSSENLTLYRSAQGKKNIMQQKEFGNFYEPLAIFDNASDTQAYMDSIIKLQENQKTDFERWTGSETARTHDVAKHRAGRNLEDYKKLPADGIYDSLVVVPVNLGALDKVASEADDVYLASIARKQNIRYASKYPSSKQLDANDTMQRHPDEIKDEGLKADTGDIWETLTYPTSDTDSFQVPIDTAQSLDEIKKKLREASKAKVITRKEDLSSSILTRSLPTGSVYDIDKREASFILNMMLDDRDDKSWKKDLYPNIEGKASDQDKKTFPALANISTKYTGVTGQEIHERAPKNMSIYTFDDYVGSAGHGQDGDDDRRTIDKFDKGTTVDAGWSGPMMKGELDVNPISTIQNVLEKKITSTTEIDKRLTGVPSPVESGDFKSGASKRWGARVNNNQLRQMVDDTLGHKRPLMIWGPPGIGKSQAIEQVVTDKRAQLGADNFGFEDLRLSQLEAVDLRGIPDTTGDVTEWKKPSFLPTSGKGILFLDEFNQATEEVQNAAFQLILDRKIGDYRVPDGWAIIAAGNRPQDLGHEEDDTPMGTVKMSPALANRFRHTVLKVPTRDGWLSWANKGDSKLRTKKMKEDVPNILVSPDKEVLKHKNVGSIEKPEFEADTDDSYAFSHGIAKYKVDERITDFIGKEVDGELGWAGRKFLFSMTDEGVEGGESDVKSTTITTEDMGELNVIKSDESGEKETKIIDEDYQYKMKSSGVTDVAFPSPRQWEYLSDTLGAMPERKYLEEGTLLDKDGSKTLIVDRKTKLKALEEMKKWKKGMARKEEDKVLAANASEIDKKMIEKFKEKVTWEVENTGKDGKPDGTFSIHKMKGDVDVQESGTWWATVYNENTNYTQIKNMKEESTDINDVSDKALASVGFVAGSAFRQHVKKDADYLGKTEAGKALATSQDYEVGAVRDYVFPADNTQLDNSLLANLDGIVDDAVDKGKEKEIVAAFYTMLTRRKDTSKSDLRVTSTPNGGWAYDESEKLRTLFSYFNQQMIAKSKKMNTLGDIVDVIAGDAALVARLHYAIDKAGYKEVKDKTYPKGYMFTPKTEKIF